MVAAAAVIVFAALAPFDARIPGFFIGSVAAITLYVGAASFVPAAVAIVVSELFRLRSVFYFLATGGAIGFAAHGLARFAGMIVILDGRPVVYPAAGFVAGFVYWLIAGGRAGGASRQP